MTTQTFDNYELLQKLTSEPSSPLEHRRRLNDFAAELGWRPSDQLVLPGTEAFASGHLIVEHGLQNSAVISFLRKPTVYADLNFEQQKTLINASYNNLIDWNVAIDYSGISFVYNRTTPPKFFVYRRELARGQTSSLSGYEFDRLSTDHPRPSVISLDAALIRTVSLWKRRLSSEIKGLANESISALFNSIILVRALEDQHERLSGSPLASLRWRSQEPSASKLPDLLAEAVGSFRLPDLPRNLFDVSRLRMFDAIDDLTVRELIDDFYRNRYEPYFDYDFSIMSRHALSRIYEHYVSLLRFEETGQQTFFAPLPEETIERSYGNVYTPEFIARFFAKYLRKELSPSRFQRLRIGDIACGSGIFLRTMLETRFETLLDSFTTQAISDGFSTVSGNDIDANACAAARLSLSLLSIACGGALPTSLDITQGDILARFLEDTSLKESLDAVVTNPPFVNIEELSADRRNLLLEVLGDAAHGKTDLYLGLLKVGLGMLRDEGFGLFVLPKNFLMSENAAPLREEVLNAAILHCVVDLSGVRVFEDVGAYVVLVIFQKLRQPNSMRRVLVARCTDLVGSALEDVLRDREVRTPAYEVFWSSPPKRGGGPWEFPNPERAALQSKLSALPALGDIAIVKQGLITGADDVFLVSPSQIPRGEKGIYVPFMADREIEPYKLPLKPKRFVIYPFQGDEPLDEKHLRKEYPETWKYLLSFRKKLESRRSVKDGKGPWWKPNRPREPGDLLRPKIVSPHLVIAPRFALDAGGLYAVSHTPYIVPDEPSSGDELLYLLGVLNSTACFWLITQNAHRYSRGYSRLEVATLKRTPVPAAANVEPTLVREIVRLVNKRLELTGSAALDLERLLDDKVADAYELSEKDRRLVGIGALR